MNCRNFHTVDRQYKYISVVIFAKLYMRPYGAWQIIIEPLDITGGEKSNLQKKTVGMVRFNWCNAYLQAIISW